MNEQQFERFITENAIRVAQRYLMETIDGGADFDGGIEEEFDEDELDAGADEEGEEMAGDNPPYEAWSEYLHGKEPLFEFKDGIIYVDYDENNGTLCSGGVTNVGFHKDGEVEVPVIDGDFQSALEEVYEQLSLKHDSLDDDLDYGPEDYDDPDYQIPRF